MQESDWKQLNKIIPEARDRYLKEKNERIAGILSDPNENETDKFWKARKYAEKEAEILNDCLGDMRRSRLLVIISLMYRHGMLRDDDLKHFSDSVQKFVSTSKADD